MIDTRHDPECTSIHAGRVLIMNWHIDIPVKGWRFANHRIDATLDMVTLPALPFLCQTTIDAMDAEYEDRYDAYLAEKERMHDAYLDSLDFSDIDFLDFGQYS